MNCVQSRMKKKKCGQRIRLMEENYYVDVNMQRNGKAKAQIHAASPKNAIILAAGYGMRMVPINRSEQRTSGDSRGTTNRKVDPAAS